MMAVCLNHVIWGRGLPSTLQTNSAAHPSGADCDVTFSMMRGANVSSPLLGSVCRRAKLVLSLLCFSSKGCVKSGHATYAAAKLTVKDG